MERRNQDFYEPESTVLPTEDEAECLVFRTSLQTRNDVEKISAVLDNLPGITDWHVDLEDWEKVLRIECTGLSADHIIEILLLHGVKANAMSTD